MLYAVVAIRDIKTDSFFPPQMVRSIGGFLRQLGDDIQQPRPDTLADTMKKHPDQFEVHELGSWDDETGYFNEQGRKRLTIISDLVP